MRQQNRRAFMATPRGRRVSGQKAATTAGARRTRGAALAIDVSGGGGEPQGESLGAILGVSAQWGDPLSGRRRSNSGSSPVSPPGRPAATAAAAPSLAAELGALGDSPAGSLRSRPRSSRGTPSPFGDASGGFGLGFGASVSLAEQFAAAAKQRSGSLDRPQTADASTSTDPLPMAGDAATSDAATQGAALTACIATATDQRVGVADCGIGTALATASREVQVEPAVATVGIATS
ncbi:hypothetical protein H4R21_007135, partial [Coemansia helicoidea]